MQILRRCLSSYQELIFLVRDSLAISQSAREIFTGAAWNHLIQTPARLVTSENITFLFKNLCKMKFSFRWTIFCSLVSERHLVDKRSFFFWNRTGRIDFGPNFRCIRRKFFGTFFAFFPSSTKNFSYSSACPENFRTWVKIEKVTHRMDNTSVMT